MAAEFQSAKVVVSIETIIKNLERDSKRLEGLRKTLLSIASIKLGGKTVATGSFDKAAASAQRLLIQQQKIAVQTQELANRQEKARQSAQRLAQAADRLAQSQSRLAQAQERVNKATSKPKLGPQQDAQVVTFRALERARKQQESVAAREQNRQRQASESLQRQRSAALVKAFKDEERAAAQTARKREQEAKRAADTEIREANRAARQITENQRRLVSGLQSFGQGLRSLGQSLTVGLTVPLTALGILATRNAVSLDSLKRGLAAITGSADDAAVQLDRLREIAKAPGIGFQEAIQGSIRLQAVGFSALEAERALVQFANAIALTGGGREELGRVTVQLGQLAAKGKVVAQDLKPIIEAAPAVGQALLQAFGTVNSEDIQKLGLSTDQFLNKLLDALDDLPKAAVGAKNAFENFSDSVFVATSAIGEAILPPLTRIINTLEPIILDLADKFRALSPGIQTAVIAIAALAAAAGPFLFIVGGIVTGLGTLIGGLTAVAGVIGTIGFPALLAALGGIVVVLAEWAAISFAVFRAWQTNFLGIRQLVANAANAVLKAFGEIKEVFDEATKRILPTLESITNKVVTTVTALWNRYGKDVVEAVGGAFAFIVDVTKTFLREFGNFVDLVAKLIDSDWQGAWRAFSRIVLTAITGLFSVMQRLNSIVTRAFRALLSFILSQAIRFVAAAEELARKFTAGLVGEILLGAPKIRDALTLMLLQAAAGVNPAGIAALLIRRLFDAMRKAAAEGAEAGSFGPTVGIDVGGEAFRTGAPKAKPRTKPSGTSGGGGQVKSLLDQLRQAQDELLNIQSEGRLEEVRAGIEQQFQLTKDGLDRELNTLKTNFEDRLVALKNYLEQRKRLEEAAIDAELTKERGLSSALFQEFKNRRDEITREFQRTVEEINRDPKVKGRERDLAFQTAEQKKQNDFAKALNAFESENASVSTRILLLRRQRAAIGGDLLRIERQITEEINRQQDQLRFDLLEAQGETAEATAGRLKTQFKDTLKDLRVDVSALSPELQKAISNVDLSVLKSRLEELPEPVQVLIDLLDIGIQKALIAERTVTIDRTLAELRLQEARIQEKVLDGVLSERDARAQIAALQQITSGRLLDILASQLAIAKATEGQEDEVLRIEQQMLEIERLGKVADEVGQDINRALFGDISSGLTDLLNSARKGFDGLKDAALGFLDNLLNTLNQFAAEGILRQLEGIFKPDATDTKGTPGGFLSKLFGLSPKTADTAELTTAAGTAGTALATGGTAASTALAAGAATASGTLVASLTAAAASFSAAVIAAGTAFASAVGFSQSAGGIGAVFGAAETGLFPAVSGGLYRFVEGGYPEAVLTTDPKHAAKQVGILRELLKRTRGFYGRIPSFASGALISRETAELNLLNSINRAPQLSPSMPNSALQTAGGAGLMNLRINNMVDSRELMRPYVSSEEFVTDVMNVISKKSNEVARRLPIRGR